MNAGKSFVERDVGGFDSEFATLRHGVAGVDGEVHDDLIDLAGIGVDGAEGGAGNHDEIDVFADHAGEHFQVFGDDLVEVENLGGEHLLAAEGEELAGERGGAAAALEIS